MVRRCAAVLAVVCAASFVVETGWAADAPNIAWTRSVTGVGTSVYTSLAMDNAGNVYVTGSTDAAAYGAPAPDYKGFVAKYSGDGTLMWDHVFIGIGGTGVAVDGTGAVYVSTLNDIRKYDSLGGLIWNTPAPSGTQPGAIAVDNSGTAYITGASYGGPQAYLPFVSKITSGGSLAWTTQLTFAAPANSNSIAVDGSGNPVIVGTVDDYFNSPNNILSGFAVKLNNSGQVTWNPTYGLPTQDHYAGTVAVDSAGSTYITMAGGTPLFGVGDPGGCYLIKYDAGNNLQWYRNFQYNGGAVSMAIDKTMGLEYVVGDVGILEFDSAGTLLRTIAWQDGPTMAYGNGHLSVSATDFGGVLSGAYVADLVVPEAGTLGVLAMGSVVLVRRRRRG